MLKPFTTEINVDLMQAATAGGESSNASIGGATIARGHEPQFDDVDEVDKTKKRYTVVVEISP
jgi:hypothetical protein